MINQSGKNKAEASSYLVMSDDYEFEGLISIVEMSSFLLANDFYFSGWGIDLEFTNHMKPNKTSLRIFLNANKDLSKSE